MSEPNTNLTIEEIQAMTPEEFEQWSEGLDPDTMGLESDDEAEGV